MKKELSSSHWEKERELSPSPPPRPSARFEARGAPFPSNKRPPSDAPPKIGKGGRNRAPLPPVLFRAMISVESRRRRGQQGRKRTSEEKKERMSSVKFGNSAHPPHPPSSWTSLPRSVVLLRRLGLDLLLAPFRHHEQRPAERAPAGREHPAPPERRPAADGAQLPGQLPLARVQAGQGAHQAHGEEQHRAGVYGSAGLVLLGYMRGFPTQVGPLFFLPIMNPFRSWKAKCISTLKKKLLCPHPFFNFFHLLLSFPEIALDHPFGAGEHFHPPSILFNIRLHLPTFFFLLALEASIFCLPTSHTQLAREWRRDTSVRRGGRGRKLPAIQSRRIERKKRRNSISTLPFLSSFPFSHFWLPPPPSP